MKRKIDCDVDAYFGESGKGNGVEDLKKEMIKELLEHIANFDENKSEGEAEWLVVFLLKKLEQERKKTLEELDKMIFMQPDALIDADYINEILKRELSSLSKITKRGK